MKYFLSMTVRYGLFLVLPLLTFGCRKELCYDHELHSASVKTVIAADWEQEWERAYDFDWEQNWKNIMWCVGSALCRDDAGKRAKCAEIQCRQEV